MNETQWKAILRKDFDLHGISLSLHGHGMQAPGWPDLWVGTNIYTGWIELKSPDREVTTAQRIIGRKLERFGQFVVLRALPGWKGFCLSNAEEKRIEEFPLLDLHSGLEILRTIPEFLGQA